MATIYSSQYQLIVKVENSQMYGIPIGLLRYRKIQKTVSVRNMQRTVTEYYEEPIVFMV